MNHCKFCPNESKYTCPKCNALYCSSKCFKSEGHGQCSEDFYRGLVEDQLKGCMASDDSRKKMEEILERVYNEDKYEEFDCTEEDEEEELDSDDEEDLATRMAGVDLEDADSVWSQLSETEKRDFLNMINKDKLNDIIPVWQPWWITAGSQSITEVKEESKSVPAFMEACPKVLKCSPLNSVTKTKPSPCIPFNIINVLASYAWVLRVFNGDVQDYLEEFAEGLLSLCPVLSSAANYSSAQIAVGTPKVKAQDFEWLSQNEDFSEKVKDDVTTLLKGPNSKFRSYFVLAALSDVCSVLQSAKDSLKTKSKGNTNTKSAFGEAIVGARQKISLEHCTRENLRKSIKKIEYFLSYMNDYWDKVCVTV